jgi:hypothetical protein
LKVSPASKEFSGLTDYAADCIYEIAMSYPLSGMREYHYKNTTGIHTEEAAAKLREFGYTDEQIAGMKKAP